MDVRSVPIRTCVGCREVTSAKFLVRTVVSRGEVAESGILVVDVRGDHPGRGAWIHPQRRCIDLAVKRAAFGRALRFQHLTVRTEQLIREIVHEE